MHELSIAQNLLQITLKHAEAAQARRVTKLHLVIGQMSNIIDDSIQFCWDVVAKGTIAEGSILHFERTPARFRCTACNAEFELSDSFTCPHCRSHQVQLIGGDDFRLDSIEIEPKGTTHDDNSCG
jgi:hydrogenase nickel incorporation protein HypA/HybF